jgi:SAM-dependent methyltransferase
VSFFRGIFGSDNPTGAAVGAGTSAPFQRRSTGFHEFIRTIGKPEGQVVLDLGPTSPANLHFITGLGHRAYNEDLLLAASDPDLLIPAADEEDKRIVNANRFLSESLDYEPGTFDAVLLWDLADYLPEALVKSVIDRLHRVMKPKGILFGFFHTRDAGPESPYYRFNIAAADTIELRQGPPLRLQRIFNNRHVENLFHDYASVKFFLGRDNLREVLVIR